jgi:hypothetical protein
MISEEYILAVLDDDELDVKTAILNIKLFLRFKI